MTAALYHPLSCLQASFGFGGSAPINVSTYSPAISTLLFISPLRLAAIAWLSLQIFAYTLAPCRTETLSLMSLHISSDIHSFVLRSLTCGFGTALRRAAKMPSSLVGLVGGLSGSFLRPPELLNMLLLGGTAKAYQHHVMVGVVSRVPDEHIPKETSVFP